ncbi:Cullin family protein [Xylariomycetidae sp. FL2044]|nr:Cullin family protein [Xylariomycetidae sp. FL2044]
MTADTKWNARRRRAIQSVFPTDIIQPTPYSTPSVRFTEPGQPFGGPGLGGPATPLFQKTPTTTPQKWKGANLTSSPAAAHLTAPSLLSSPDTNIHAAHQTRFDRSWHTVTSRIALPPSVSAEDSFGPLPSTQDLDDGDEGAFDDALRDVLDPASRLPHAGHTEDLLAWHTQQVRMHFVSYVLPMLVACDANPDRAQVLLGSIRTLEAAHRQYLWGLALIVRAMDRRNGDGDRALRKFRRDLHAIVGNSMSDALMDALRDVLGHLMRVVLGLATDGNNNVDNARKELHQLVESLCKVGLAGERFQILFAELLDGMMVVYVQDRFSGRWEPNSEPELRSFLPMHQHQAQQPRCIRDLSDWIENHYARLAVEVTNRLGAGVQVAWTDVEKWKEFAVGRLAALRIDELFDIVMSWPNSQGAVDDLRFAVTTPQRRLQLTDAFSAALQSRLLHPGRSTLDILRTYIAMIRAFHKLDHSRVLLDRVACSLQIYLRTRDDAVRIVVSGLLSSPKEVNTDARKTKLVELVKLLYDPDQYRTERQDEEWDDLTWVPPPVDAGSNYKRRKSEDVIGTLISALGSPEVFIKEFQNIIGERLLSEQGSFEQEVNVLSLLKKRFGEASLQACDVMIKDIQDSQKLDGDFHRVALKCPVEIRRELTVHARILSRLYWPDVGEERFHLPPKMAEMHKMYEVLFERFKKSRKLKWLQHLGQATVELELEDRTVVEEVHTYEAAVVYCFGEGGDVNGFREGGDANSGTAPSWTFDDLWMRLEMDEDLLTAALEFWEKKRVLRKLSDGRYVVVERLSDYAVTGTAETGDAQATPSLSSSSDARGPLAGDTGQASSTPRKGEGGRRGGGGGGMSEKEREKRQVYWQFIVGMLTNSRPAMPLAQIAMMMKMLIADGFPWSNEELQEFLAEKCTAGELEIAGGKYRLVKK